MRQMPNLPASQQGVALFLALIMLLVLTLLGLSSSNTSTLQERMVANSVEAQLAFQRAEAGLRQIEIATSQSTFGGVRSLVQDFNPGANFQFNDCTLTARVNDDWNSLDWNDSSALNASLNYVVNWSVFPSAEQGFGFEFVILNLVEYEGGGLPRVSCRMGGEVTNEFGASVQPDFYLIVARARGRAAGDRQSTAIVQSIYWWP